MQRVSTYSQLSTATDQRRTVNTQRQVLQFVLGCRTKQLVSGIEGTAGIGAGNRRERLNFQLRRISCHDCVSQSKRPQEWICQPHLRSKPGNEKRFRYSNPPGVPIIEHPCPKMDSVSLRRSLKLGVVVGFFFSMARSAQIPGHLKRGTSCQPGVPFFTPNRRKNPAAEELAAGSGRLQPMTPK